MGGEELPYPVQLQEGVQGDDELAVRIARYEVLHELGFFGIKTTLDLAIGNYKGTFQAGIRKRFSGIYQNTDGCHPADIEVAMELTGNLDEILDWDLKNKDGDSDDGA